MKQIFILVAIKLLGLIAGFALSLYIARYFGVNYLAEYHLLVNNLQLVSVISCIGLTQFIVMKIPQVHNINNLAFLRYSKLIFLPPIFAVMIVVSFKAITQIIPFFSSTQNIEFNFILTVFCVVFFNLLLEFQRATRKFILSEVNRQFSLKIILLLTLICSNFVKLNDQSLVMMYLIAVAVALLFNTIVDGKSFNTLKKAINIRLSVSFLRKVADKGSIFYQNQILLFLQAGFTILLLGTFSDKQQVALYATGFQLASITGFVFASANIRIAPLISRYHSSGKFLECQKILKTNARIVTSTTLVLILIVIVLSDFVLGLYGEVFRDAKVILLTLSFANFANALTGPAGLVLEMIGKQRIRRNVLVCNVILIFGLSVILIPNYGANGLAVSILVPSIALNVFCALYVKYHCRYQTFLH